MGNFDHIRGIRVLVLGEARRLFLVLSLVFRSSLLLLAFLYDGEVGLEKYFPLPRAILGHVTLVLANHRRFDHHNKRSLVRLSVLEVEALLMLSLIHI